MKQTLDHNKEANKKQNIVENIEAQIDLNEILDQKKFLKNNIFEYDWCLEQKGQLCKLFIKYKFCFNYSKKNILFCAEFF